MSFVADTKLGILRLVPKCRMWWFPDDIKASRQGVLFEWAFMAVKTELEK